MNSENDKTTKQPLTSGYEAFDVEDNKHPFSAYQEINTGNPQRNNQYQTPQAYNLLGGYPQMAANQMNNLRTNLSQNEYVRLETQTMGIKLPKFCEEECFNRLFPRKVPRQSSSMQCPACQQMVNTKVSDEVGCGLITCFGVSFCCAGPLLCWIPFCLQDCYDIQHKCPNCNIIIAEEKFLRC